MQGTDPDIALVERAQRELPERTAAYDELVREHSARVYQRSYRILQSAHDAEEATQDVFLAVVRNLRSYRRDQPFRHWLSTITLNACRMVLRRRAAELRRRDAVEAEAEVEPEAQPELDAPSSSDPPLRRLVLELLDELDPGTRIPLLLRFVEGYTNAEVASELDLSESAVKMRVSRGAKQLRERVEARRREARERRAAGEASGRGAAAAGERSAASGRSAGGGSHE